MVASRWQWQAGVCQVMTVQCPDSTVQHVQSHGQLPVHGRTGTNMTRHEPWPPASAGTRTRRGYHTSRVPRENVARVWTIWNGSIRREEHGWRRWPCSLASRQRAMSGTRVWRHRGQRGQQRGQDGGRPDWEH